MTDRERPGPLWLTRPRVNRVVWKYDLALLTHLQLPQRAQVLHVGSQDNDVVLWVAVDPDAPKVERAFRVVGTGHEFDPSEVASYHGTAQLANGLVFHVLELWTDALRQEMLRG